MEPAYFRDGVARKPWVSIQPHELGGMLYEFHTVRKQPIWLR